MNVDVNVVMQNLVNRISQLELDLAVKDAQIQAFQKEIDEETNIEPAPTE